MHMADALLSPAVGGTMWAASAGTIAYCSCKVRNELDSSKVPLMGVLGAFIFAAQLLNFSIPLTGSSGHFGGSLLLSILLGPYAAFLCISSVLLVQALFFADGGLLALGCNIFNIGFFPAFIAYPFIYKSIIGKQANATKISTASVVAAIVGLQLGAFAVVLETVSSEISSLPFSTFVLMMQPIHLAIGVVEGLITATVISFVYKARPDILHRALDSRPISCRPVRNLIPAFLMVALIVCGFAPRLASNNPDGLEWSIAKVTEQEKLKRSEQRQHATLNFLQDKTAFLPDYSIKKPSEAKTVESKAAATHDNYPVKQNNPVGSSMAGLFGGILTFGFAFLTGFFLKRRFQSA